MSSTITLVLLSLSVLYMEMNCQVCTPIGTNNQRRFTAVRDSRFYLNTAHPAPCGGTINRWRYCYYRPSNTNDRDYRATFAVYRIVGTGDSISYKRVSNVFTVSRNRNQIRSRAFRCINFNVNGFTIEAGDFVAACVYDPADTNQVRRQLDIVGGTTGYSLMQMSDVSQCGDNSLPSNISSSQLSIVNSSILHLYATITNPIIPTTLPLTTTMSTTEQTTAVTWTTATPSDTTTALDRTTTTSDESSTTTMISSSSENPTTLTVSVSESPITTTSTVSDVTTTQTLATQSTTTTSSTAATVSVETTTDNVDQSTSSENEKVSTTQTTPGSPVVATNDNGGITSEETDTTTIKDDVVPTIAQIGTKNSGSVIIGVTIVVALLVVTGIAVAIIVAVIFKKHGKNIGTYSLPGKKPQSNRRMNIPSNGVDNLTYDVGFHNPGTLDSSFNLYDDVTNSVSVSRGEGNYFELAESGFSNQTYESVTAEIYSELSAAHTTDTQASSNHQNPSGRISCSQLEYYYSSPEDSKECLSSLLERNKQEDIYGNLAAYYAPASNEDEIYSQLESYGTNNIPHNQIRIMGHLGSGQFGNVEKGMWQSKEVALKTLKTGSLEEDKVKFLQEAAIMAQFKHPNIVTLHGVVSDKQPLMLVVELMHRGDLRDHLHSIRPDPGELPLAGLSEMLLGFSQHVALGMQYLSGKGFVHRDLAARNILVSKDNVCKVADFGMSRDLADETYYVSHGGMIPVKWTAPEAIHYKKYSTASDVWSYGCLLYEIWSLGYKPFEGITNVEVIKILDSKKRLSPPPGCPRMIYELMINCWDPVAGNRPRFRELTIVLTGNPHHVLSIPQEALDVHKLAGVLGSPLEAGKNMYSDLQNKYCSENNIYD